MPGLTGVEAAPVLHAERPGVRIILFSAYLDTDTENAARLAGVDACVSKSDLPGLMRALRAA
jgi:CheY-like chemotaxis protein